MNIEDMYGESSDENGKRVIGEVILGTKWRRTGLDCVPVQGGKGDLQEISVQI